MIKLNNFEENFKKEDTTEIKKREFKKLYEIIYKNSNPNIDFNNQLYYSNAIHNNKEYFERYEVLNKQLTINSVLQTIMDIANNDNLDNKVTPFNRTRLVSVIKDIDSFKEELYNNGIDTTGFEVELFSLDEIRLYLYNSIGINISSISDMYDEVINQKFGSMIIDYGELIVQGINPDSIRHPEEKAYVDEEMLRENGLLKSYIIDGNIYGKKVLSKNEQKIK